MTDKIFNVLYRLIRVNRYITSLFLFHLCRSIKAPKKKCLHNIITKFEWFVHVKAFEASVCTSHPKVVHKKIVDSKKARLAST